MTREPRWSSPLKYFFPFTNYVVIWALDKCDCVELKILHTKWRSKIGAGLTVVDVSAADERLLLNIWREWAGVALSARLANDPRGPRRSQSAQVWHCSRGACHIFTTLLIYSFVTNALIYKIRFCSELLQEKLSRLQLNIKKQQAYRSHATCYQHKTCCIFSNKHV